MWRSGLDNNVNWNDCTTKKGEFTAYLNQPLLLTHFLSLSKNQAHQKIAARRTSFQTVAHCAPSVNLDLMQPFTNSKIRNDHLNKNLVSAVQDFKWPKKRPTVTSIILPEFDF